MESKITFILLSHTVLSNQLLQLSLTAEFFKKMYPELK